MTKTTSEAQKRARAEQRKPCCEGYVGMATFNAQMCLDRDATLRKVLVKHEALETAQLWVKLHKHGYHCTKQDVSRFRFRRKNGSLHVARPEDGDGHANAEAEYKAWWEAQRAVEKAKSERRAAERAAEMAFLEQQAAAEQAAKEKAAAEKAASEAAAQKAATVATIEAAADKAAERVVAARLSSRALVLAHACESAAESPSSGMQSAEGRKKIDKKNMYIDVQQKNTELPPRFPN